MIIMIHATNFEELGRFTVREYFLKHRNTT